MGGTETNLTKNSSRARYEPRTFESAVQVANHWTTNPPLNWHKVRMIFIWEHILVIRIIDLNINHLLWKQWNAPSAFNRNNFIPFQSGYWSISILYNCKQARAKIRANISRPWSWPKPVGLQHYIFLKKYCSKYLFSSWCRQIFHCRLFGIPDCNGLLPKVLLLPYYFFIIAHYSRFQLSFKFMW